MINIFLHVPADVLAAIVILALSVGALIGLQITEVIMHSEEND